MRLHFKALLYEFDGPTLMESEYLDIPTKGTPEIFTKEFIIPKILEAQESGDLKLQWIDKEKIDESIYFALDTLEFSIYDMAGESVYLEDSIYFRIIPETTEEFDCYFQQFIHQEFDETIKNAVLTIPTWNCFVDYDDAKVVGNSLIIPGYQKFLPGSDRYGNRRTEDYWYVIQIKDLAKSVVTVSAPEWIVPHLIGKGGKNIQKMKDMIKGAGFDKVKRVEIHPFKTKGDSDEK